MESFFILMGITGYLSLALTYSLIDGVKTRVFFGFCLFLVAMCPTPFLLRTNVLWLESVLNSERAMEGFSFFVLLEILLGLSLGLKVLRKHYYQDNRKNRVWAFYLPATSYLIALSLLAFYLVSRVTGMNDAYFVMSIMSAGGMAVFLGGFLVKKVFRDWGARIEFKLSLLFFQGLIAAFIPVFVKAPPIVEARSACHWKEALILFSGMAGVVTVSALLSSIIMKKWRKWNGIAK